MTTAEKDVLFQLVSEVEDLRALVTVLLARNEQVGDPALLQGDKVVVLRGNQESFETLRNEIRALI
jgi:hypothetical protein